MSCNSCQDKIQENCAILPIEKDRYCKVVDSCRTVASNPVSPIYPGGDAEKMYSSLVNDGNLAQVEGMLQTATETQLKNQIKYDLCQMASCRLKCQDKVEPGQDVWSEEWWYKNIWGENQVQRTIYLLSLLVVMYLNVKIFLGMALRSENGVFATVAPYISKLTEGVGMMNIDNFVPLFLTLLSFVVMAIVGITYTAKVKGDTPEELKAKRQDASKIFSSAFFVALGLSSLFNFVARKGNHTGLFAFLADICNIFLFSLFILFNFAFGAYIPQLMLVGIILQRFFLGSWSWILNFALRAMTLAVIVIIMIVYWSYTPKTGGTVLSLTFLAGFLLPTIGFVVYRRFKGEPSESSNWSMVLMPVLNLILNMAQGAEEGTLTNLNAIGVSNSEIFGT